MKFDATLPAPGNVTGLYTFTVLAGTIGAPGSADGTGATARFNAPKELGIDAAGNVYVADSGAGTVRNITPAGLVTTVASGLLLVNDVAPLSNGDLYVTGVPVSPRWRQ